MVIDGHSEQELSIARKRMIAEQIVARGIKAPHVIETMGRVPRHIFVDDALRDQAYMDGPLNIGEGQTISQPYIVAFMTESLQLTGQESVLEIGTGCGYQTTLLALLTKQIHTVERIKSLAIKARSRFKLMGLKNIVMRVGDGSQGWPEAAPFDRIIVTCAAPVKPEALMGQLKVGGLLVVPVAVGRDDQDLLQFKRTEQGFSTENLGPCRFVRLIGKYGYNKEN